MMSIYSKYIKQTLLVLLLGHCSLLNFAVTYYVSNAGNDSNSGLSSATPWKTLNKVSKFSFVFGDQVLLKCSDVFYENITHISNNLIMSSYGSGNKPEIRGWRKYSTWDNPSSWTEYSPGVWKMAGNDPGTRLWINGAEKKESKTLNFSSEYCWRFEGIAESNGYLYLKSPSNPANFFSTITNSRQSFFDVVILANCSDITINGISITGGRNAIRIKNGKNITIKNCEIGYRSSAGAIYADSNLNDSTVNLIISDNIFNSGDSLRYNYYRRSDVRPGDAATQDCINLSQGTVNSKVYNNYIYGWSHCGVYLNNFDKNYPFHDNEVYNNFITAPLIEYSRGLAADIIGGHKNSMHDNTVLNTTIQNQINADGFEFYNNIIDNVTGTPFPEKPQKGYGIAIEAYASPATNMQIFNNTILNCFDGGIRIYGTSINSNFDRSGNNIHDNNLINNRGVGSQITTYLSPDIYNNLFLKNHLYNSNSTNVVRRDGIYLTASEFNSIKPANGDVILDNDGIITYNIPVFGIVTVNPNDLKIEYNETAQAKIVSLNYPMIDVNGNKHSNSVTLKPYSSLILLKDYGVISTSEYKSICEGANYFTWTLSGKYERTLAAKTGADSIVTTYLTVNPKYSIVESITINEGENYNEWTKAGQYTRKLNTVSGCDSTVITNLQVSINATKQADIESTQTIELVKGYNLISTYIAAPNPDASVITKELRDQNLLVKIQDEAGNSLEDWGAYGGWINQLGAIGNTKGYKILVANDCTLQLNGKPIELPMDIPLKKGWNIISFPRTDLVNAMNVIQPLIDQNLLLKVQDELGHSIEDWGAYGSWINGIGNFVPGKAYKVELKADASLSIRENYVKSGVTLTQFEKPEYFTTQIEGNGTDHMNINIAGLSNAGIAIGDELAAFDGGICVGILKITEEILSNSYASLIASYSTDDQNQNGFKSDDPIQIYVWNKLSGEKLKVNVDVIKGQMKYEKNSSVLIEMKSITTGINNLKNNVQIDVFPNPCQGYLIVRYSELPITNSRIEISDISGHKFISRVISGTSEEFKLSYLSPGLYFVRSILGTNEYVNKLIINN